MTDAKSSSEIEREIEEERARLTDNLDTLQERFSADTIVREIGNQIRENGGDISRSIGRSVKDNPIPLALTGIGLAWMMFGGQNTGQTDDSRRATAQASTSTLNDGTNGRLPISDDDRRAVTLHQASRYGSNAWAIRDDYEADGDDDETMLAKISGAASHAADGAKSVSTSAADAVAGAVDSAKAVGASAAGTVSDAVEGAKAKSAQARWTAEQRAALAQAKIDRSYRRLSAGTEDLSEAARERVIAARREAMIARERVKMASKESAEQAADLYQQQPLVAGALALALGAALGAALPRTKMEDDNLGEQSDALFSEAERIFKEERDKAVKVADAVVDQAATEASNIKADLERSGGAGSAVDAVKDRVEDAAKKVGGRAQMEAEKQKLGQTKD